MKPCFLIPNHDHGDVIGAVLDGLAAHGLPCLVVDDGSGPEGRDALAGAVAPHPFVELVRLPYNQGKGAALKVGYRTALARGFTHVVQLDADGQHDPADAPRFLEAMRRSPEAFVVGVPIFDDSAPVARLLARQLSVGLVWVASLSRAVPDPLIGYRGLPLAPTVAVLNAADTGNWMDFDPELAVRLVWEGLEVVPVRTRVCYPQGGRSHFSLARDYPRLAWLYTRLISTMLVRSLGLQRAPAADERA